MSGSTGNTTIRGAGLLCLFLARAAPAAGAPGAPSPATVEWYRKTEQALMDAIAAGDRSVWERAMDPSCVITSEEGEVLPRAKFLEELAPLPPGLSGAIAVKDLTVQELPGFAVVRYLADETETVFGQRLAVRYRVTDTYRVEGEDKKLVASHLSVITADPPAQGVDRSLWPSFAGAYRLFPDGWTFHVELRDGELYGGRDPKKLRRLVPLAPDAFVASGSLGEWMFVVERGRANRLVNLRKFAVLVWTRVEDSPKVPVTVRSASFPSLP